MAERLKVSVVINTYNRAESLKSTLESLYHQTDPNFEVIVVNGPSTDNTEDVVKPYLNTLKFVSCPERNLSVSRNLGIEAASGDIVAFIDDDGIADPNWIRDLIDGYDDPGIGGVGGLVYDHTGMQLQYHYSSCDRKGDTDYTIQPPFSDYNIPYADKFLYLQGTNCSFRKEYLVQIGGFDEEFEYYLDEVDVCMRIIDAGYKIKPVDNAVVHHKYMKSFLRNEKKVVLHPYSTVKNKYYFAVKNNNGVADDRLLASLGQWKTEVIAGGNYHYAQGNITKEELSVYQQEVTNACKDGIERGQLGTKTRQLTTAASEQFIPFKIIKRTEKILKICYLSKEYPPDNFGGIGRYTFDLATTFAAKGHEVHVITEGSVQDTVDFENGVWVHRLVSRLYTPFESMALGWNLSLQARNYFELLRIHAQSPIDIVNGPVWLCETGMSNCSTLFPTVMTLMTTQRILNDLTSISDENTHEYKLMKLEESSLSQHRYIHAISTSIMANCKEFMSEDAHAFISPLGCRDLSGQYISSKKEKDKLTIYSVGRLEHRKGTDLLLSAAEQILSDSKYNNVEFVIAGKETTNTLSGKSYKEEFCSRNKNNPDILNHVTFLGEVSEEELMKWYRDADIACTPSRYESFGIVLLEGMSFNNAIVAANAGGMKDIIKDGETGLFFETNNAEDLTRKLKQLLDDETLRMQLARNARTEYEKIYSLDAVYSALYEEYCNIIEDFTASGNSNASGFMSEQYAQMISDSEHIDLKKAVRVVTKLLDNAASYSIQDQILAVDDNSSGSTRFAKKIYHFLKGISPAFAIRLRNRYFRYFYGRDSVQVRSKELCRRMYHVIRKIPVIGWIIRYIVDILLLPVKAEKITYYGEQLLNNDALLNVIGQMVEQQTAMIRDISRESLQALEQQVVQTRDVARDVARDMARDMARDIIGENTRMISKIVSDLADLQVNIHYDVENQRNQMIDTINKRLTDIRSEILFELMGNHEISGRERAEIEPRIINQDKLAQSPLKLNVGAGHICYDDYINIDQREINNIDVVADIRDMPFEDNSVDEIFASHLIEHFTKHDLVSNLLPYWNRLLVKGGRLVLILPDLENMIMHFHDGDYAIEDLRLVLYGLQEYPGDVHYALYGQDELAGILEEAGFEISYTFKGRKNGQCYDMEIVGVKK